MSEPTHIVVRGATEHNLKNVDLTIPRDRLVVFTGVSGSGKSSLAYDTIYKEGQRRFMESLSSYARQYLGQMERPRVDSVDGVSPTVSIDQKTVNRNPRSTVGTVTEIYDHLRLLMARLGTPRCPQCHTEIKELSVDQVVDRLIEEHTNERMLVLGPIVNERKGEYRKELEQLQRDGWLRARIDGVVRRLDEEISLARYEKHTIEVVVDRLRVVQGDRTRLYEAVETASRLGGGMFSTLSGDGEELATWSTHRACPNHPEVSIPELEPRLFSFNAPQGACTECSGLGALVGFDVDALIDTSKTVDDCFLAFNDEGRLPFAHFNRATLVKVAKLLGAPVKKPVKQWTADQQRRLVHGDPSIDYTIAIERGSRSEVRERTWRGLLALVENVWHYTHYKGLEPFRSQTPCPSCKGERLNPIARAVVFRGERLPSLATTTIERAQAFFSGVSLEGAEREIGGVLVQEICDRLDFLVDVGLGYLSLSRSAATLSGGEAQRIRLAAQVGSALQGVTYVLDEPSIGLHPRDNKRLLATLQRLRDRGNSVLVVEHDAETIASADFVVDVGPGAGRLGGEVVSATHAGHFMRGPGLTAQFLRREQVIEMPAARRSVAGDALVMRGASRHNLRDLDVRIPLGTLTVVTGVSGSGKSTLVFQLLERALTHHLHDTGAPKGLDGVDGLEHIDKVIRISQQPIGRTPRSNPGTYVGVFDHIRALFASTPEARARGYKKGRFSFNVKGGRCEVCQGAGVHTIEMQFLPSVEVPCEECSGRRFNSETLEITFKSRSIADVLDMTIEDAAAFFENQPKISRMLSVMVDVGLGYVSVGQPSTTLSGGEAQRVKLATELHRPATGRTIYLLDEPTTGLHFADVRKLVQAMQKLVDAGNTVLVVEHDTDVMKCADHLIDLGPEGGVGGGLLVGEGTPEHLATLDTPTGRALAALPELGAPVAAEDPARYRKRALKRNRPKELVIEGARLHNLRGVDVTIPHNQLTVISGPSGSGKTSLAFDTIFSEGQRRYVESLSTYARRFLGRMERAPVERLEGLAPSIAIDQKNASRNPRSTVATVTEIHDVLRLLYARIGELRCWQCEREVVGHAPAEAASLLAEQEAGAGWLLADLRPIQAKYAAERREGLVRDGWLRLLDDGEEIELTDPAAEPVLVRGATLVVDRLNPSTAHRSRVSEAVASAYALGDGKARFLPRRGGEAVRLSQVAVCPEHGQVLPAELTPRHFSFNSRLGACPSCDGVGNIRSILPELLFPEPSLGFWEGMDPRVRSVLARSARHDALIGVVLEHLGLTASTPTSSYTEDQEEAILHGLPQSFTIKWEKKWGRSIRKVEEERVWEGLVSILEGWNAKLGWLSAERPCRACRGGRLRKELLSVRIGGASLPDLCAQTVADAYDAVQQWELSEAHTTIAERPLLEVRKRLKFLCDVGLGYLQLERTASTLSGGESQRIRLASQLGSGLVGVIYVLDEPTIGLHPRDTERLLGTLEGLRDLGNTVIVVEHDPDTVDRADFVIDMGPEAGINGGEVVAVGTPTEIRGNAASPTGRWLSGVEAFAERVERRQPRSSVVVKGARENNLKGADVAVPLGVWTSVSGVSGSGKSSLIMDTLAPALQRHTGVDIVPGAHDGLELGEKVDRVVIVDQSPLSRSPRSTPATYTNVMNHLRKLYSTTLGASERAWGPGRFSYNSPKGGRCGVCEGRGAILVEMHFLPDVWVECDACRGKRYDSETLAVRWRGYSIADVLGMRADEAVEQFKNHRALHRQLKALVDVGLGYITLGQPATTLSGGEAQRVKLASELTSRKGHCVYILDEPTTGLHLSDVSKLVDVLHRLVDAGHTVVTVEHHLDMLRQSDWIIDLGPEGGAGGGQVVGQGTPEHIATLATATGAALRG